VKSNWSLAAVVRAKLALVLVAALFAAASASSAEAKDPPKKQKGSFDYQQLLNGMEHFDNYPHVQQVGKPTQIYSKPKGMTPYLNPNGSSDHPPHLGGYWLGVSTEDFGNGPEVVHISYGSPASRIGLEQGDIIHEVDGIPVTSRWELSQAIRYSDGFVRLLVEDVRTGQFVYRMVRLTRRNLYPY
jgi:membrane-associated protease RseP (regulator of RpoE activity)